MRRAARYQVVWQVNSDRHDVLVRNPAHVGQDARHDSIDSLIDWRCTARIKVKLQDNLIIRLRQCRRRRIRYQPAIEGKAFERAAQGRAATHRITKNVKGGRAHFSGDRSEEHTSELQSLMRISYAVFCLKKK